MRGEQSGYDNSMLKWGKTPITHVVAFDAPHFI